MILSFSTSLLYNVARSVRGRVVILPFSNQYHIKVCRLRFFRGSYESKGWGGVVTQTFSTDIIVFFTM